MPRSQQTKSLHPDDDGGGAVSEAFTAVGDPDRERKT